jgi:hypothetical protein
VVIKQISVTDAQELADDYGRKWKSGTRPLDQSAVWVGAYGPDGILEGCIGFTDTYEIQQRLIHGWYSSSTRNGKIAAGAVLEWVYRTCPVGFRLVGTVVTANAGTRKFLKNKGWNEVAVIVTRLKEE